jgi:alpha/beta superfamily hydrolase
MSETIFLPGGRDARGALDSASVAPSENQPMVPDACVVACPPHPQYGGRRGDRRLRAVSDALDERGVDCLRVDYGPWDGGRGEREDAINAVAWARERYDRVGLFGYSFGGTVALSAAPDAGVEAVSALAPSARLGADDDGARTPETGDVGSVDAVAAIEAIPHNIAVQILYGARYDVADVDPVVECARIRGHDVVERLAGHGFDERLGAVAATVADFLTPPLRN